MNYYPIHEIETMSGSIYGPCIAVLELSKRDDWSGLIIDGRQLRFWLNDGLCNHIEVTPPPDSTSSHHNISLAKRLGEAVVFRLLEIYGRDFHGSIVFKSLTQAEAETLNAIANCPIITL